MRWRTYAIYGIHLSSQLPLPCEEAAHKGSADVTLRTTQRLPKTTWQLPHAREAFYHEDPDGTQHLAWPGHHRCAIAADGRTIWYRHSRTADGDLFRSFLLSQAISFALLKAGLEPLHATALALGSSAIGLLGDSGAGKSTIAASFLQADSSLLCDDLLTLKWHGRRLMAYPGLPRIKLFPQTAAALLGIPHNAHASIRPKRVIPLPQRAQQRPLPLHALYVLHPTPTGPRGRITLRRLNAHQAYVALITHTYNPVILEPARLARQFRWAGRIAQSVPLYRLSFPKRLDALPRIRQAVLASLERASALPTR